ncbi:hypothetical protein NQ318_013053 [Aromia moschata]|uniref:Fibronectin type-III domain-containing protein n=1 Tax=Aromia moschata TaxID=1265417 RepID=A0AAV8XMQ2_9CUCU|nr:hypothetical protein NQ318_013053 [Aromia moschata]
MVYKTKPDDLADLRRITIRSITPMLSRCWKHFNALYYSELLPSPPENVEVEALTEKSLKVEWSHPVSNTETVTEYSVNVTSLENVRRTADRIRRRISQAQQQQFRVAYCDG